MNGIEMASIIQDMCHEWQINHGHSKDRMTGAFVLYDFMKARGEDVTLVPAIAETEDDGNGDPAVMSVLFVSVKSDIGKVENVNACEFSANLETMRYFTKMTMLKAWMDCKNVILKEKKQVVVKEYLYMMKLSLRVHSKDSALSFRGEKYKEMKASVENEYMKYITGFIKTAIKGGVVKLPFTEYILGVLVVPKLVITVSDTDVAVVFTCPYLYGGYTDKMVFAIGVDADSDDLRCKKVRRLSKCEIFGCIEKIMTIFRTVEYDKLHGFIVDGFKIRNDPVIIPNIDDICCVCRDPCFVKTKCSHTLCLQCWGSIIKTKYPEGADDFDAHINCPMCRQSLNITEEVVEDVDKLD